MVLCEAAALLGDNFFVTWGLLTVLGFLSIFVFSGSVFGCYYWKPTFEQWQRKLHPDFPSPKMVRNEILQTFKGLVTATVCPALSLYLASHDVRLFGVAIKSQAFCGVEPHGWNSILASFAWIWVITDFYEWGYHFLGHSYRALWNEHKSHHKFYNPSPFAVIADDMLDQLVRSAPLVLFPMLVPVNIDLLFFEFVIFFYGYGTVLHWGFESEYLSAHQPYINGPFEHHYHHRFANLHTGPIYTGFFFKLWDNLAGSVPKKSADKKDCFCSRCAVKEGLRSKEAWDAIVKPDYSVLFQPSFWFSDLTDADAPALEGKTA